MGSSMFPNPDARAAQEAEGRGWQMENRVNRRFQEAAWAFSCDTLETLLWHFGNTLVTPWRHSFDTLDTLLWHPVFSRAIHMSAAIALFTLSIYTYWLLFRDAVSGISSFDLTIADPSRHKMTSSSYQSAHRRIMNKVCIYDDHYSLHQQLGVHIWWLLFLAPKIALKSLTFAEISFTNSSQYSSVNRKQSPLHAFQR